MNEKFRDIQILKEEGRKEGLNESIIRKGGKDNVQAGV